MSERKKLKMVASTTMDSPAASRWELADGAHLAALIAGLQTGEPPPTAVPMPACPKCGGAVVQRRAKPGAHVGRRGHCRPCGEASVGVISRGTSARSRSRLGLPRWRRSIGHSPGIAGGARYGPAAMGMIDGGRVALYLQRGALQIFGTTAIALRAQSIPIEV